MSEKQPVHPQTLILDFLFDITSKIFVDCLPDEAPSSSLPRPDEAPIVLTRV
ncbi:hypothetical protein C8J57DRAFT_1713070 [Mycena rebaudengoi]|nr:hypothetical protein C8J57DRAFT_1713070 [Mycena rebaudengoi]